MWNWIIIGGIALYALTRRPPSDPTATAPVAPVGPTEAQIDDLYQLAFASDRTAIAAGTGLSKGTLDAAALAANTVNVPVGWLYSMAQQGVPAGQLNLAANILNNVAHTQPLPIDTQPATLAAYRAATLAKAHAVMQAAIYHAQIHGQHIEFG